MELPTRVIFATPKVKEECEALQRGKTEDKKRYDQLQEAFAAIEKNGFCGIQIKKRLMPKLYLKKFNIHNLWKCNLSDGWRLLYSIENQEGFVVSIIIEWLSHKEYDQRLDY